MHTSDICIIGDGAIGKTAALCLAHAGFDVMLLHPSGNTGLHLQRDEWDARVYALNHVAHQVLSSAKVWDALDASRIAPVDAMDVRGDDAGRIAFDAYAARVNALAWIVEDSNLNQALDAALRFAPNVKSMSGRALRLESEVSQAQVMLENGDILSARLVVGADGAQSWVRGQCDLGFDRRDYGQRAVVANFECEKPHHGVAYQWFAGSKGIIALLPLPGCRVSLVWSAPEVLAAQLLQEPPEQLAQRVSEFCVNDLGQLRPLQPGAVKSFPLMLLRPHAIVAPRVALIGDAAHVVHPLAGHGMNLGFGDVAALVKEAISRGPHRDCGDERVLARYARARKEEILLMQWTTDGMQRLFDSEFEPLRFLRNTGLNIFNGLPFIKRRLVEHAIGRRPSMREER